MTYRPLAGRDPDRSFGRAWTRRNVGAYIANEALVIIGGHQREMAGRIPVVWCHGFFADADFVREDGRSYDDHRPVAALGYPVLSADLGGASTWGNTTAIGRIDTLLTWAGTNLGVRTDKVIIGGESMGSLLALNWAWRNHQKVAAVWVRAPVTNLDDFRNANASLTTAISDAYGGVAAYFAALPAHDPTLNTAKMLTLGPVTRLDFTASDELIRPQWVEQFASDIGGEAFGHPGNHNQNLDTPSDEIADWIDQRTRGGVPTMLPWR